MSFLILALFNRRFLFKGDFCLFIKNFSISLASEFGEFGKFFLFSSFSHNVFTVSCSLTDIFLEIAKEMSWSFLSVLQSLPSISNLELPFSKLSSALQISSFVFLCFTPTTPSFLATSRRSGLVSLSHFLPPIFMIPFLSYVIFVFLVLVLFFVFVFFLEGFLFGIL